MRILLLGLITLNLFWSCDPETSCSIDDLSGQYIFFSDSDTSTHTIQFSRDSIGFTTTGLLGYGFWFPNAPLSGRLDGCKIILDEYKNVKREGLPSPGGTPRFYYETLEGNGEFFPENDSIFMFIHYYRTENFQLNYEGNIYFKKKR